MQHVNNATPITSVRKIINPFANSLEDLKDMPDYDIATRELNVGDSTADAPSHYISRQSQSSYDKGSDNDIVSYPTIRFNT